MRRMDPDKGVVGRFSPNVWTVGDTVKIGDITFRAAIVYPSVLFEVVDDEESAETSDGVPESSCEGAV